jgi:hypothetical protein
MRILPRVSSPLQNDGLLRNPLPIAPLMAACLLVAGCELVDQRTVARWLGETPLPATETSRELPELPLVTIRFDQPDADYAPAVSEAAQAALARKSNAVFDIVTPVPTALPPAEQDAAALRGAADARAVADTLATQGVPPEQLRLGLVGDPGEPPREVRVYVR